MISSGRGGAGNVRSPSRDPLDRKRAAEAQVREDKIQEEYRAHESKVPTRLAEVAQVTSLLMPKKAEAVVGMKVAAVEVFQV